MVNKKILKILKNIKKKKKNKKIFYKKFFDLLKTQIIKMKISNKTILLLV